MKKYLFPLFIFFLFIRSNAYSQPESRLVNMEGVEVYMPVHKKNITPTANVLCTSETPTNATIPSNFSTCDNKTTTLTVIANGTVNWYSTPTSTISLFTGTSFITPTLAAGAYTFYAACTSGTCTESTRLALAINVLASPTTVAVSGGTVLICNGSVVTLTVSGANTYSWSNGATTNTVALTPSVNTTYTARGTATATGCYMEVVKTITVGAVPSLSISGSGSVCAGQSAILNILGADTYSWNTGATTTLVVVSPTITTNYTVTGTYTATGCKSSATIDIVVSPCTGIINSTNELKNLQVYPNPTSGELSIELNNGSEKKVEVLDLTGRAIYRTKSTDAVTKLNLQSFNNGIYFIRIQSNGITQTFKVVKQ